MKKEEVFSFKRNFGDKYVIEIDEAYKLDKPEHRDPIEWYYIIPAKYGQFYLYGGDTIAFYCTANRIKKQILRKLTEKVTMLVEAEDESILLFHEGIFPEIAPIAKAKRRRGRKALSEIEKKQLLEAGKRYRFTGKSLQNTAQKEGFSPRSNRKVAVR